MDEDGGLLQGDSNVHSSEAILVHAGRHLEGCAENPVAVVPQDDALLQGGILRLPSLADGSTQVTDRAGWLAILDVVPAHNDVAISILETTTE